jgi:hypothetical protein
MAIHVGRLHVFRLPAPLDELLGERQAATGP